MCQIEEPVEMKMENEAIINKAKHNTAQNPYYVCVGIHFPEKLPV